jgi:hypothetical protein
VFFAGERKDDIPNFQEEKEDDFAQIDQHALNVGS